MGIEKGKPLPSLKKDVKDIRKVLIVGSGRMGQQIGMVCAIGGYDVMMYDISRDIVDDSIGKMEKLAAFFVKRKDITEEQGKQAFARVSTTTDDVEAGKDADVISESVPEDPGLKGRVFARFNETCPEHTVFTTNTSSLIPSMFAEQSGRPEKLCCLHFHDVRTTNIVDVMPHPGTDGEVTRLVRDFALSIGQLPIVLHKESGGFVFNAMLEALFEAALKLAANDVASVEDIDRAWVGVTMAPLGPFALMDQIGLKTVYAITKFWADKTQVQQKLKNAEFLKKYLDAGKLGRMTGEGFYKYPDPAYADPDFVKKLK